MYQLRDSQNYLRRVVHQQEESRRLATSTSMSSFLLVCSSSTAGGENEAVDGADSRITELDDDRKVTNYYIRT